MSKRRNVREILNQSPLRKNETESVISSILEKPRLDLYLNNNTLSFLEYLKFRRIAQKRKRGYPLQYLLGEISFFSLDFKVTPDVLIPRPETELVLEKIFHKFKNSQKKLKILDMCTGSGVAAVVFARCLKDTEVLAVDISKKALRIARHNARENSVADKITFQQGDLFDNIKEQFDLIFINPPYVASNEIDLSRELSFEPRLALDGGQDGLDYYRNILFFVHAFMKRSGYLYLEIPENNTEELLNILRQNKFLKLRRKLRDYNNKDRCLEIIRK